MSPAQPSDFDAHMMAIALRMATRGLGQTAPNPAVGAVIADEATGEILARATTAPGGRPHAETQVIAAAGARCRGATLYVTLEPCSHVGQTAPCADAVIAAGFKRVVVAIEDPDPRVAGRGLDRLRAAGIEVLRGVGAAAAKRITRGHIVRVTERRPKITLKMAFDARGQVPRGDGDNPTLVTSDEARWHAHVLRARHDAILVGEGTVRDDDPLLTCRLPGMAKRSPIRIMLSRYLNERWDSRLAKTTLSGPDWLPERAPFWVFCSHDADPARRKVREETFGVQTIAVRDVAGRLWLPAIMEELVARGVTRLLVEGGPTVWRAFCDARLVDDVVAYMAGPKSANTLMQAIETHTNTLPLSLIAEERRGPDTIWFLTRLGARDALTTHKQGGA